METWKEIVSKALEYILDWTGDSLYGAIGDLIKTRLLLPNVIKNMENGVSIYNGMLGNTIDMLTTNPMDWNASGWTLIMNEVYPVFLTVACPLVVIFFLIDFCSETPDMRMSGNTRPDRMIPLFFKLGLAEFVTVNALWIICLLFSFVNFLTGGWLKENANLSSDFGFTELDVAKLPGLLLLLTYIASLVYLIVLIIVAAVILYTATIRFYKILTLIPVGALASSTIAGSREISHTAMTFWKYIISVVLESVLMLLILALFSRIQNSLVIVSLEDDLEIMGEILNRILISFLLLGSIKGAGSWLQRATGL